MDESQQKQDNAKFAQQLEAMETKAGEEMRAQVAQDENLRDELETQIHDQEEKALVQKKSLEGKIRILEAASKQSMAQVDAEQSALQKQKSALEAKLE